MTGETPRRAFRIPDAVYLSAQAAANHRGETLTDVVLRCLREYGDQTSAAASPSGVDAAADIGEAVPSGMSRRDSP